MDNQKRQIKASKKAKRFYRRGLHYIAIAIAVIFGMEVQALRHLQKPPRLPGRGTLSELTVSKIRQLSKDLAFEGQEEEQLHGILNRAKHSLLLGDISGAKLGINEGLSLAKEIRIRISAEPNSQSQRERLEKLFIIEMDLIYALRDLANTLKVIGGR